MTEPTPGSARVLASLEWHLVDRHFAGESTPDEAEAVRRWVAEDAARAAELEAMHRLWLAAAVPESPRFDVGAGWRALQPRMREVMPLESAPSAAAPRPPLRLLAAERPRPRWRRPAALAAAVLLMVSTATLSRHLSDADDATAVADAREYVTDVGQRTDVMLADGSRAWLAAGSRLRVSGGYGDLRRELHLEGEGYFDVAPDSRRPFIVHANGVVAEALGTEFVVRRYDDDAESVVVVVEGTVAVRTDSGGSVRRGVALTAGQRAEVDSAGLIVLTKEENVSRYTGWRDGRLEFHGAPLRDVARELSRWYDVQLVIEDPALATVPVTGTFTNVPGSTVVSIICQSLNTTCEADGRRVRVRE